MSGSTPIKVKREGDLAILSHDHSKARDCQRRSLWEPSSKTSNTATLRASHAGIASNARTSLSSTGSCEPKASPNVKPPKRSRFLERPCKPGAYGTTPSISVLMEQRSFKAAPDLPFYTG